HRALRGAFWRWLQDPHRRGGLPLSTEIRPIGGEFWWVAEPTSGAPLKPYLISRWGELPCPAMRKRPCFQGGRGRDPS
ncbi:MAG: hypothetical protein VYD19_10595, partial [Myxococcota bacterium]|nr:hypothetical protein [Myxococcota bacterium]